MGKDQAAQYRTQILNYAEPGVDDVKNTHIEFTQVQMMSDDLKDIKFTTKVNPLTISSVLKKTGPAEKPEACAQKPADTGEKPKTLEKPASAIEPVEDNSARFIELQTQHVDSQCIIEMENRSGIKMRMCFTGDADPAAINLGRYFLEGQS